MTLKEAKCLDSKCFGLLKYKNDGFYDCGTCEANFTVPTVVIHTMTAQKDWLDSIKMKIKEEIEKIKKELECPVRNSPWFRSEEKIVKDQGYLNGLEWALRLMD